MNLQTYEIPDNDRPNYFKLKEGENKIRIVSEILDYGSHFVKEEKKSHICLGAEECKYCKAGDRPRTRYMTWVIDRSTGELKLFDRRRKRHLKNNRIETGRRRYNNNGCTQPATEGI